MSNLKTQKQIDPAVEEVLASIRHIMAMDDEKPEVISFPGNRVPSLRTASSDGSEILTLTEFADANPREETPIMAAKSEEKNKENNEEVAEESTEEQPALDLSEEAVETEMTLTPDSTEAPPLSAEDLEETKVVTAEDIDSIMSPEAVEQSAAAFADLNKLSQDVHQKMKSGEFGNQTVDELMRELLKPLLKEWLDSHLPSLVKWLVAEKIEQMIREKQDKTPKAS